jgi:hypothetical protein
MAFESTRANCEHVTTECSHIWLNLHGMVLVKQKKHAMDAISIVRQIVVTI